MLGALNYSSSTMVNSVIPFNAGKFSNERVNVGRFRIEKYRPAWTRHSAPRLAVLCLALGAFLWLSDSVNSAPGTNAGTGAVAADRIHLQPHLHPGQSFRYQLDLHTAASSRSEGPISDPQGASRLERSAMATVHLEVLRVDLGGKGGDQVRLRATYDHCSSASQSDALDVKEAEYEEQFRKLNGTSVEFTLDADGRTHDFAASRETSSDPSTLLALQQGTSALTPTSGLPSAGIIPGDKWTSDREFQPSPLAGLYWHTDSAYLRNETCPRPSATTDSSSGSGGGADNAAQPGAGQPGSDVCAVIQTKLHLLQHDVTASQTPDDYLKNGLRTSGSWTGSAEAISDISLSTGLVVTMTQTGSQDMDFRISTAQANAGLRYIGHVDSQTAVTQLPPQTP
jgi:hypothetical protein